MTALKGTNVLVTGGGRGIGKALVEELYARGARKVYATARDPRTVTHPRRRAQGRPSRRPCGRARRHRGGSA
ncbi:SDR family NAD(P)-dependent oxidoreductase [Nonomuraea sp. NPDC048901]|uniref:SDR family NAD(P)-dependent oxidoreductase n=1 Tax=Nonomuraea sp. NPDC048901 TaxID=3155627 RepID=UPI0033FAF1D1